MSLAILEGAASIYARAVETLDPVKIMEAEKLLHEVAVNHYKEIEGLLPEKVNEERMPIYPAEWSTKEN